MADDLGGGQGQLLGNGYGWAGSGLDWGFPLCIGVGVFFGLAVRRGLLFGRDLFMLDESCIMETVFSLVGFPDLLRSDVVTLCCSLTSESQ